MASDTSANRYRDVLYEALAGSGSSVHDADPLQLLARLTTTRQPQLPDSASSLLGDLQAVSAEIQLESAIAVAAARFESPERFGEAIYFARCLGREPESALALLEARRYLEEATVPISLPELQTDRAAVLDAATFAALWHDAARLDWMLHTTSIWRRDYVAVYIQRHAAYNADVAAVAEAIEATAAQTAALERLNTLERLGSPVAQAVLLQFHDLEKTVACSVDVVALAHALATSPVCPGCGFQLGDEAPSAEARRVRSSIERGLATQQSRLAQRVVSRLLSRPMREDRLDRFVKVVQASDLGGLAIVLDDSLVDFLRELLEDSGASDVLQRLAAAYPEVTADNLVAVVANFRSLLEADIAHNGSVRLQPGDPP